MVRSLSKTQPGASRAGETDFEEENTRMQKEKRRGRYGTLPTPIPLGRGLQRQQRTSALIALTRTKESTHVQNRQGIQRQLAYVS